MYEPRASWYEPDYEQTPEDNGYIHESDLPDLEQLRDHLQGVAEAFYETGDAHSLENCLDECFHVLGMTLKPNAQPAMEKRGQRNLMMWHLGYQRATIDQMNRR